MSNVCMGVMAISARPQRRFTRRRLAMTVSLFGLGGALSLAGCSNAERDRVKATTQASYDRATGKLSEITFDRNKNGRIDTWTKMDGSRPLSSEIDTDEDGKIDRWEEYGPDGKLVKAMWERPKPPTAKDRTMTGRPDAVAYIGADGLPEKIEYLEVSELDPTRTLRVVRREFYQGTHILRAEEDTLGDGVMDRFENFDETARMVSVEFDETGDGQPDRKLTYGADGRIVSIETEPDGKGGYLKKVIPGRK
jgi:hypothetical protein